MKQNIIIIGKKSFIGSNLFLHLNLKYNIKLLSYENFLKKKKSFLSNYKTIINCASNKKYIKNKYLEKNDFDLKIANKIKELNIRMIFLSTRKIYKPKFNIRENEIPKPNCNYSKNKLITEKKLKYLLKKKILVLRISNIIGLTKNSKNKLHKTFIDIFFFNIKKGFVIKNDRTYKDFLSIKKFCEILDQLIKKNISGTYNVSLGKKVYLSKILKWLNYYNVKNFKTIKLKKPFNNICFTLNNDKLMNQIKIKNRLTDLENDCKIISKKFFLGGK